MMFLAIALALSRSPGWGSRGRRGRKPPWTVDITSWNLKSEVEENYLHFYKLFFSPKRLGLGTIKVAYQQNPVIILIGIYSDECSLFFPTHYFPPSTFKFKYQCLVRLPRPRHHGSRSGDRAGRRCGGGGPPLRGRRRGNLRLGHLALARG